MLFSFSSFISVYFLIKFGNPCNHWTISQLTHVSESANSRPSSPINEKDRGIPLTPEQCVLEEVNEKRYDEGYDSEGDQAL